MKIYFDHSATTPVDGEVLKAMLPYFSQKFGNASSIHGFGQEAIAGVDKAREQAAGFLNCSSEEIIFTSGATESNNLAIKGFIRALEKNSKQKPHIITSLIEHDAVLEPCLELEKEGIEVSYLPVKPNGVVDMEKFKKAIKDNTVLVSIMYVNSEVGSVQPVREIGKIIKKINDKKLRCWQKLPAHKRGGPSAAFRAGKPQPIYFHTDATQAVNFFNCDVKWNYIDMLSMSAHKIYGPKGVGALYKKREVPMSALQRGGHHENNLRSGTLNVAGIVGLGKTLDLTREEVEKTKTPASPVASQGGQKHENTKTDWIKSRENLRIAKLRDLLVSEVKKNIPNVILNTDRENSTPSHAHFSFLGVEGESILIALDMEGIAVSTGSACASGSLKASHVLLAMGIKKEIAHNSIRFTLGKNNTEAEIRQAVKKLIPIVRKLRKINPLYKKGQ